jgi:cellulose synthase/poly-beta-1,6-N-acetylglucosamine synthase-like glycosyltransferase
MALVFWISCAFVAYVYAGYPVLLILWARLAPRRAADATTARLAPPVSIVIAARNEAPRLAARLDNLLRLDYPSQRQIIVVSDGSTDDTLAVLSRYGRSIDVVVRPPGGKPSALNAGVALAKHEVLVFCDARQTFKADALRELTAPFADPSIAAVTGELILECEVRETRAEPGRRRDCARDSARDDCAIAEGVGMYWRYEKALRRLESRVGSTLGATGAVYAMRRTAWRRLPDDAILDDVLAPMRCVLDGSRVIFNERAVAYEHQALDTRAEMRRKVRTLAGNWQILALEPRLLVPWRNPVWLQYVSHKIGRLLVPYALVAAMALSIALAARSIVYAVALILQCVLYLLGLYGAWSARRRQDLLARAARLAYAFVVMNASAVAGFAAFSLRRRVWR